MGGTYSNSRPSSECLPCDQKSHKREVCNAYLLAEAMKGTTENNNKKMVSRLRVLEKFGKIGPVLPAEWLLFEALTKFLEETQDGRAKQWATMECL